MSTERLGRGKHTKHGELVGRASGPWTPEYTAWTRMRQRCYLKTDKGFKRYGGRGISVCDRWRDSFSNFLADVGRRPSVEMSIDRTNNDGNYEPGNVRWATWSQQMRNRRDTRLNTEAVKVIRHFYGKRRRRAKYNRSYGVGALVGRLYGIGVGHTREVALSLIWRETEATHGPVR